MKLKYYLRGIGVGIIFSTIIMLIVGNSAKMSDAEIIKEAEKLGMVLTESSEENFIDDLLEDDKNKPNDATTTEATTTEEGTTTEATTTDATTTEENTTTEATTTEEASVTDAEVATIQVVSGMNSYKVSMLLQEAGIIEDGQDFDNYLNRNGYSSKIQVNTFTFTSDMTYEEIAEKLVEGAPQ